MHKQIIQLKTVCGSLIVASRLEIHLTTWTCDWCLKFNERSRESQVITMGCNCPQKQQRIKTHETESLTYGI